MGKPSCISEEQAFAHGKMISLDHFNGTCKRDSTDFTCFPIKIGAVSKAAFTMYLMRF